MDPWWYYRPIQPKLSVTSLPAIYRPPEYLLLAEAVDEVGKASGEWTGEEMGARKLRPPSRDEDLGIVDDGVIVRRRQDHQPGSADPWLVLTASGNATVKTETDAWALWRSEHLKLLTMWKAELAARERFETVIRNLRSALSGEELQAWVHRTDVGSVNTVPSHFWGSDGAVAVFEMGNEPTRWVNPGAISIPAADYDNEYYPIKGRVVILERDLWSYLAQFVVSVVAPEQRCQRWLVQQMQQGPPAKPKTHYKAQAKVQFGLGSSGFMRAWIEAIKQTGNLDWRRSGPKSKRRYRYVK